MEYVAFEYERRPSEWCVEAQDGEGTFHCVFFSGPNAEAESKEYATWKNACEVK